MTPEALAADLRALFEGAGYTVNRSLPTDGGAKVSLLLAPPSLPADLHAVAAILTEAGHVIATDWQPAWLELRKVVVVTVSNPDFAEA